jgi:hypothetical protein
MTYREAAEIVRRKLAGGDISTDFPVQEEEVYFVMQQLVPVLIQNDYIKLYRLQKSVTDATIFTTITANVFNGAKESYLVLPSAPLFLNGTVLPKVTYIEDRFTSFVYVDAGQLDAYKSVGVLGEISGILFTYEYVEGCTNSHRLVFFNLDDCVKELRVRLVQSVGMDNFNPDKKITIKPELNSMLLEETYKWFLSETKEPEDRVMDGKKDKV